MKCKFYLFLFFSSLFTIVQAQQNTDSSLRSIYNSASHKEVVSDNIYVLGKVWGFLKYYHPNIAAGKYDWDKELIDFLPGYTKVASLKERNDSLLAWIKRFGEIPACKNCNDSILEAAKLKPDFTWMNENDFSPELLALLKNIKENRIQSGQYYTKFQTMDGVTFVQFQHESAYGKIKFPNDAYGLLSLFRFWNVIEYWYPYKYNLTTAWDTTLKQMVKKMLQHQDAKEYTLLIEELVTAIEDSHGYYISTTAEEIAGKFYMPFTIRIVENKIIVTSILNDSLATLSNVKLGDVIERIDGITLPELIKKYEKTIPASNYGALLNKLAYTLIRSVNENSELVLERNKKNLNTKTQNYLLKVNPTINLNPAYFSYQKDSSFCIIKDKIGYINVGNFKRNDSVALANMVGKVTRLIIDNRQNQDEQKGTGGGDIIGGLILPAGSNFVKFSTAQPSYPGVFTFTAPTDMGTNFKENYFKGELIILIDEGTFSVGEFLTMVYQNADKAKTLGSTTTGADGNVTYLTLPGGIYTQFTGLGVYYPNGAETQRVGIKPDLPVKPTIQGYRNHVDEQLNKAVEYLEKIK